MSDDVPNHRALLPAGLRDLLPPDAETEASSVEALMEVFAAHGYQRVKPPLLEFEDSLLAGSGAAVAEQTFRLMDPDSQRMMGLRADTTPQVARIATTRLAQAPRPLRLSYAGQCLRVRGSQLAPDRQIAQAGIELIGCDNPAADAEIVLVGAEALAAVGPDPHQLRPDPADAGSRRCWTMPGIAGATRAALARALDRKDAASVARHGGSLAPTLTDLLLAAGPADRALAALRGGQPAAGGARPRRAGWPRRSRRSVPARPTLRLTDRSGGVPRLPLRDRRLGHDLRARPARGAGPRRALYLRRGRTGDRPHAVSRRGAARRAAARGAAAALRPARRRSGRGCADAPPRLCHHRRAGAGRDDPVAEARAAAAARISCANGSAVATEPLEPDAWPMSR